MATAFIGRQPIFNRKLRTQAYELLYRSDNSGKAGVEDDRAATASLLLDLLTEVGLEKIVGKHPAWINVPEAMLLEGRLGEVLPTQCALEILETVRPTPEVVEQVGRLKDLGYTIVLDDFAWTEAHKPLVALADVVKLDVLEHDDMALASHMERIHQLAPEAKLLAEKIEQRERFNDLQDMGFDYFQGYFFARPQVVRAERIPANQLAVMELIGRVNDPEVGLPELAEIIARDAALSVKTLRYVNSPAVGLRAQVESVQQALTLLGLDTIRHWVTVLSIAGMDFGDNSPELFLVMLTRARFCELVSKEAGLEKPGTYFTIGLLSAIDVLMNADMEKIIGELPLTDEVKAALIRHEGVGGDILRTAMALEQGLMNEIMFREVDGETLNRCWLEAMEWADEVNRVSEAG